MDSLPELLTCRLEEKRPSIITVSAIRSYIPNAEATDIESKLHDDSVNEEEEEQIRTLYFIKGYKLIDDINGKVLSRSIVHSCDKEVISESLTDSVSSLYGIYKGNKTAVCKLPIDTCTDLTPGGAAINLPVDLVPDGNCRRDRHSRPRKSTNQQDSIASTSNTSIASTTSNKSSTTTQKSSSTTQKSSSSKSTASSRNSKASTTSNQAKLFFGHSKPKVVKKDEGNSIASNTTAETERLTDKDSPSKSSDKENSSKTVDKSEEKKPKRSRIQVFSSDSESEVEELKPANKPNQKKSKGKSSETDTPRSDNSQQGSGKSEVINRTGLKLDPDDLQNESDEDELSPQQTKKRSSEDSSSAKAKRPRRKTKRDTEERDGSGSEDEEGSNAKSSRSKKNTPNFGAVKSGDRCSSMKYVDKTYLDKDGFLVTEKVLEEVDEPAPPSPPKQAKDSSKPKQAPTSSKTTAKSKSGPKQQSSLLSFFNKK